jgi:hypothetical protein
MYIEKVAKQILPLNPQWMATGCIDWNGKNTFHLNHDLFYGTLCTRYFGIGFPKNINRSQNTISHEKVLYHAPLVAGKHPSSWGSSRSRH